MTSFDRNNGRYGNVSFEKIGSMGVWLTGARPQLYEVPELADRIADTFDFCSIVLNNGVRKPFYEPVWDPVVLAALVRELTNRNVFTGWMTWPYATLEDVKALKRAMRKYLNIAHNEGGTPRFIQPDCEGRHNSSGWGPAGFDLAEALVDAILDHPHAPKEEFQFTSIIPVRGMRKQDREVLVEAMKHFLRVIFNPQLYSQYQKKKEWTHRDFFRAGPIQRHGMDVCKHLYLEEAITGVRAGIMTAFQSHPEGPKGTKAVDVVIDTLLDGGVNSMCVWDSKLLTKAMRNHLQNAVANQRRKLVQHDPNPTRRSGSMIIADVQRRLNLLGYKAGPVDGIEGPRTRYAVEAFEKDSGLKVDGQPDGKMMGMLVARSDAKMAESAAGSV